MRSWRSSQPSHSRYVDSQHQTITKMLSDALFIGLDPNGATITKRTRGVRQELDRCQHVMQHDRLVHIELKVTLGARKCDRVVVAKNLDCDHRERLTLSRIDLSRHNRGAGFIFGNPELTNSHPGAAGVPADIVADFHEGPRKGAKYSAHRHQAVVG